MIVIGSCSPGIHMLLSLSTTQFWYCDIVYAMSSISRPSSPPAGPLFDGLLPNELNAKLMRPVGAPGVDPEPADEFDACLRWLCRRWVSGGCWSGKGASGVEPG